MSSRVVESVLTNQGDYGTPFKVNGSGGFFLRVSGTFNGTVQLQRAVVFGSAAPAEGDWGTVTNDLEGTPVEITTELQSPCNEPCDGAWYRPYYKTKNSGTPTVQFSQ